jgi:gamma-glutamyltranspeptidase / glutathione hydrolase
MPGQSGNVLDLTVNLEEGISEEVRDVLRAMGHKARIVKGTASEMFGRGQLIRMRYDGEGRLIYSAGSDPRGDGASFPII